MTSFNEGLEVMARCFRFVHRTDVAGHVVMLLGVYGYEGYYGNIYIYGEDEAIAARRLMDSRPGPDEAVWHYQGDAVTTIQELLAVPKPHEPGAPGWPTCTGRVVAAGPGRDARPLRGAAVTP